MIEGKRIKMNNYELLRTPENNDVKGITDHSVHRQRAKATLRSPASSLHQPAPNGTRLVLVDINCAFT